MVCFSLEAFFTVKSWFWLFWLDSSLLQSVMDRFDSLQTYVGERFDSLESQVDILFGEMDSRITKIEGDVTFIRDCFDLPLPPST